MLTFFIRSIGAIGLCLQIATLLLFLWLAVQETNVAI